MPTGVQIQDRPPDNARNSRSSDAAVILFREISCSITPANRGRISSTLSGLTTYANDANSNQQVQITPILDRTTDVWNSQD